MKKCLTVLLVIAVMFTFSFGSAFAAALPTPEQQAKIATEASKYTDATFARAAETYSATLTFKDGKLIDAKSTIADADSNNAVEAGVLDETLVNEYVNEAAEDAQTAFNASIASLYDDSEEWDDNLISTKVASAYNSAVDQYLADGYVFSVENTKAMLKDQIAAAKSAAATDLAAYSNTAGVYSDNVDDWSYTTNSSVTKDIGEPGTYSSSEVTGKTATQLTAKGFVDAVVDTQTSIINRTEATGTITADVTAIGNIEKAVKTVKDVVGGHKITTEEAYYIAPVPTIADLDADTTLAEAKTRAIAQMEAALTSKVIAIEDAINNAIAEYEKQASLSDAEKDSLAKLEQAKADLSNNVAAVKEVYTAKINYAETKADVTKLVADSTTGDLIVKINSFGVNSSTKLPDTTTQDEFDKCVAICGYVDDLEAAAELYAQQKDVNGKPYYDYDVLQANLKDEIKKMYEMSVEPTKSDYNTAESNLLKGFEANLIQVKINYIDFINGTQNGGFTPENSKGQKVTAAWNTVKAKATRNVTNISVMASGSTRAFEKDITTRDDLYSTAAKAALKALVDETTSAIEAATDIASIEQIFAEANDEYEAIQTVNDHKTAWITGAIGKAYTDGKYDTELLAHVTSAGITTDSFEDYPTEVNTVKKVMTVVVYPIVYEATSADELAAKVAEAKTAVDNMLTADQVADQKKEVEALINAIGTVTLDSKNAIVAAADAAKEFEKVPGATTPLNQPVLTAAINNYEDLAAKELTDAYNALKDKAITTADESAVNALRTLFDDYTAFCEDYGASPVATPSEANIETIEDALLAAQVKAVTEMMIKLPANPTAAQRDEVLAARAAYEALPLEGQKEIVETLAYQNLIDAEEYLDITSDDFVKAYLQDLSIVARSVKTASGNIKVTINADVQPILDAGYTVEYKFYRSTKPRSNYGTARMIKTENVYTNTTGTKGVRYYYKAMIQVKDADGNIVATTPLSQCKYACRVK